MMRRTVRRARKRQRCTYAGGGACTGWIEPGTSYAESWASPDHDGITPPTWTRYTSCEACREITDPRP